MPRKARIDYPGALHHVMARGIERRNIFESGSDYREFIHRLGKQLTGTKTTCYAWALMPNHYHLLLKSNKTPISYVMHAINTGYALYFNTKYKRVGHLFQGRFKSKICDHEEYFLELIRYINLNPLRAGIVNSLEELDCFKWTSHPYIIKRRHLGWYNRQEVLNAFSQNHGKAIKLYQEFLSNEKNAVDNLFGDNCAIRYKIDGSWEMVESNKKTGDSQSDQRIIGNRDFIKEVLEKTKQRKIKQQIKAVCSVEKIIKRVIRLKGISLQQIYSKRRNRTITNTRALICTLSVYHGNYRLAIVAEKLGITVQAVQQAAERGKVLVVKETYQPIRNSSQIALQPNNGSKGL